MTTGIVSTLKLNLSQNPEIKAFQAGESSSAKKRRRNWRQENDTRVLEKSLVTVGGLSLVGLFALWKRGQMTPENGLLRSINAQSIPILSKLRLPKSELSLVETTSIWMTSINSIARSFFAMLTHQHTFEVIGSEALTRLSTVSLIKAVKGGKKGEEPIFSINRWFLNYMMKPKNLTRKIDTSVKESAWVRFNSNWRNTVGLAIQEMCGLNTPFELMFPHIKEAPSKAGTLVDKEIDAFRKRLTLESTTEDIHTALAKGVEIKKAYTQAKQAFDQALTRPQDAATLTSLYDKLADAQYDYNHHFYDLRYKQSNEGTIDRWVGRESRHAYETAVQALTGKKPDATGLSKRTQRLWKALDAKNEKRNKLTLIPLASDKIDWKTELTKLGQAEAQKSIQGLRDVLKAGVMYDLLEAKLETVLLLPDGSKGIPKDMPRRLMDILIPYAKEVTKYARYDSAYIQQVKAMKAKQPNIPLPVNLYDISDEGMLQLFKGLVDDLDSLNPAPALVRPREYAMKNGFGISPEKPLSDDEKLTLFREKALQRLRDYIIDLKEEQNLTLNQFSSEATQTFNALIESGIHDYMDAQAKSSEELQFDYFLSKRFGEAVALNTEKSENNQTVSLRPFTGKVFNILDAGFKLNERITDIDQYKRNNLIKSGLQVAFQTAVTAFVLSNVLFFIVYNTFSRLDPDYKGRGKIPLSDWVASIKGTLGEKTTPEKEKDKTSVEAKVNVSLNLQDPLLKQATHANVRRKHKALKHTQGGTST
jgi:hypothetical protein